MQASGRTHIYPQRMAIMHQSAACAKSNAEAALGRSRDVSPPPTHLLHT